MWLNTMRSLVVILLVLLLVSSVEARQQAFTETLEQRASFESLLLDEKTLESIKESIRNPSYSFLPLLIALKERNLFKSKNNELLVKNNEGFVHAFSSKEIEAKGAKRIKINNNIRRYLKAAIVLSKLKSNNTSLKIEALNNFSFTKIAKESALKLLELEQSKQVRESLIFSLAKPILLEQNLAKKYQLECIELLKDSGNTSHLLILNNFLDDSNSLRLKKLATRAKTAIKRRENFANIATTILQGLSLGSILLLTSLGLAISLGLMGVINMAHGELLMIGAYATYLTQNIFILYLPQMLNWYILFAIPVSFFSAALIGLIIERTILRHLYGRPLETLLATWGVSLLLIQFIRIWFGASNVEVANPLLLTGSLEFYSVVLPYNRIFCVFFTIVICFLTWFIFQKTKFGLKVRAVSQNRAMARASGIKTDKVDLLTFSLGSGIAGLAGLMLTQISNVGPELGQGYIVDSFLVVVFGGVGKIVGTIFSALSVGMVNKVLEPAYGSVLAKIIVLFLVVLFIQKRPEGLYSIKRRSVNL